MLQSLLYTAINELARAYKRSTLGDADHITFTHHDQQIILHIGPGDEGEVVFTIMTREDA